MQKRNCSDRCMIVFVKTKLSQLINIYAIGIMSDESRWHESVWLVCRVTELAVCGNEDKLLWTCLQLYPDPGSLETKFWEIVWADEEEMGEFPKHSLSNISGMVWVTTTKVRKLGLLEHTINSYSFFRGFRRGMVERSHPPFPWIRCWANGVPLQGPLTINLIYLTGNVEEKERMWSSRILFFELRRIRCPHPQS